MALGIITVCIEALDNMDENDPCREEASLFGTNLRTRRRKLRCASFRGCTDERDNYAKAALDAINAIVVSDDSLIVDLVVRKKYALTPQLIIVVTPLAALTAQGTWARQPTELRTSARSGEPMFDETLAPVPQLKSKGTDNENF